MVESEILKQKPSIDDNHGHEMIDLFVSTVQLEINEGTEFNIIVINHEMEFRPLLLSQIAYDSNEYWDRILFINGISNPFDLNQGDVIIIPSIDFIRNMSIEADETELDTTEAINKEINQSRAEREDDKRKSYQQQRVKPTDSSRSEDIKIQDNEVVIDTNTEQENNNLRERILKKALKRAQEEGNTVLSNQIAKLISCDIE